MRRGPGRSGGTRQDGGRPIFTDGGKFAGIVFPDGCFFKTIVGSRHLLRTPPAIAYYVSVLRRAKSLGATRLVVMDRETGTRCEAPMPLM